MWSVMGKDIFQLNGKEQIQRYRVLNHAWQCKLQVPLFFLWACETSQAYFLYKAKHSYRLSLVCEDREEGFLGEGGGGSLRITSDLNMAILPSVITEDKVHRQLCDRSTCAWKVFHPSYCKNTVHCGHHAHELTFLVIWKWK